MGDNNTEPKQRKFPWEISYLDMTIKDAEKRLGIRLASLREGAVSVTDMLSERIERVERDVILKTKEKVYERLLRTKVLSPSYLGTLHMHAYAVVCLHEYLAYARVFTRLTTKSLDVLHSFLPQPLNILDIIDISIGQISILIHYGALQISTLPATHNPSPYSQPFPLLTTFNQHHNIFPQVHCPSPPPQLPILTFITLQDLQSSAPEPADRGPLIEMFFDVVSRARAIYGGSSGYYPAADWNNSKTSP